MKIRLKTNEIKFNESSEPKQQRSKEKLERIINAAFVVTSKVGFESVP